MTTKHRANHTFFLVCMMLIIGMLLIPFIDYTLTKQAHAQPTQCACARG